MTEYYFCSLDRGVIVDSREKLPYVIVDGYTLCLFCFRELLKIGLLYEGQDDEWHAHLDNPKDLLLF